MASTIQFRYDKSLIAERELKKTADTLHDYIVELRSVLQNPGYTRPESSLKLIDDRELTASVQKLTREKTTETLRYIFVLGIGGSNLGAKAIYDAIFGHTDRILPKRFPKIIFLDTNDYALLAKLGTFIKEEIRTNAEFLIAIVSKSGKTMETAVNAELLISLLAQASSDALNRTVVITDEGSELWSVAKTKNIAVLSIPPPVPGRYSVFSAAGLFPLALAGIDTTSLLDGARAMRDIALSDAMLQNPAALSATLLYLHSKKKAVIHNSFFFRPELESVGRWYRQLLAESIGKEKNLKGKTVHSGITPTVSIGSTDLHSALQLYLGGPNNAFTTFVSCTADPDAMRIPTSPALPGAIDSVLGRPVSDITNAILNGTKAAYAKKKLPFAEVFLPDTSPNTLGQFLMWKMMEVMFLARLLNVNAFDEPAVESYKDETRKLLQS